jgi:hypothetical protein
MKGYRGNEKANFIHRFLGASPGPNGLPVTVLPGFRNFGAG